MKNLAIVEGARHVDVSFVEGTSGQKDSSRRPDRRMRAIAILVAIGANVAILIGSRLLNGAYPTAIVGEGDQRIGFAQVIIVTALAGLVAWGLLELLERATTRARTLWTAIAVVVLVLSLFGPLGGGVGISSKIALACMHIGAAAPIIVLMRRSAAA